LSPNSINSEWVKTEIRKARKRERVEKKRVLFPVRLVSLEGIRDWELFDADEGKIWRSRFANITSQISATGRTTMHIRRDSRTCFVI